MNKLRIDLHNGETYYYLHEGQNKETLLLIHGNMSSSIHFKPLIERLSDKYNLLVPDLRGFGDSSYYKGIESLEDLSDDLKLLIDQLQISKVSVAGWSTGGAIALKFAAKYKENTNKIILIESCSYRGYPIYKKDAAGVPIIGEVYLNKEELALDPIQVLPMVNAFKNKDLVTTKFVWDAAIYTVNKPNIEDDQLYLKETVKQRNLVDIDWCLTTFNMSNFSNGVTDGDNSIMEVDQEVLSIWSEKDVVVLEYMVDETIEALKNATKVVLADSGHSPLVDQPDKLADLIDKFLK